MATRLTHAVRVGRDLVGHALGAKRWWLVVLVLVCLLLIGFVAVSASPLAPFVYTVF